MNALKKIIATTLAVTAAAAVLDKKLASQPDFFENNHVDIVQMSGGNIVAVPNPRGVFLRNNTENSGCTCRDSYIDYNGNRAVGVVSVGYGSVSLAYRGAKLLTAPSAMNAGELAKDYAVFGVKPPAHPFSEQNNGPLVLKKLQIR